MVISLGVPGHLTGEGFDVNDPDPFRSEVRAWLELNCPQSMRGMPRQGQSSEETVCWGGRRWVFASEDQRIWLERMAERGWTAPEWPREYAGGGLDHAQAKVLREELARVHARPPLASFGIWMLGPALLRFGSEEQKRVSCPRSCAARSAGARATASLAPGPTWRRCRPVPRTAATTSVVNGQKIWTSYADQADWIFCLVRTDRWPSTTGISFVLFDMDQRRASAPGRSLLISGKSPFCETFFDDVRVPKRQPGRRAEQGLGRSPSTC
jgi:acyl-CoA dehydrogenase